jgi:hypothetical protein
MTIAVTTSTRRNVTMGRHLAVLVGGLLLSLATPSAASVLSTLADSMAADTWAVLTTNGISGTTLMAQGASGFITGDASGGCYDPVRQKVHFIGMDHQPGTVQRHVVYDLESNTWLRQPDPPFGSGTINHGWESTTCDVTGRKLYRRNIGSLALWRYDLDTGSWTNLGTPPAAVKAYANDFAGLAFHYEMGQSGKLLMASQESGNSGVLAAYDPATGAWARLTSPTTMYANIGDVAFAEYSDVHEVTVFGGSASAFNVIGTPATSVVAAPAAPCMLRINRGGIIHADPATGNFVLLCGSGTASWHIYNPITNAWAAKPTPSSVPNHILNVSSSAGTWPTWGVVAFPIADHGVILYVKCRAAGCETRLYKGGPFTPPPVPVPPTQLQVQ